MRQPCERGISDPKTLRIWAKRQCRIIRPLGYTAQAGQEAGTARDHAPGWVAGAADRYSQAALLGRSASKRQSLGSHCQGGSVLPWGLNGRDYEERVEPDDVAVEPVPEQQLYTAKECST